MSFVSDLTGDDGSGVSALGRAGNIAANTAKNTSDAMLQKYLASETDSTKRAAAILANAGAQAIINKLAGKEKRAIPDPYQGMDELGVLMPRKDYIRTPEHTYNTYFSHVFAGDMDYNDSHPMYNSLFLVDFKFNQNAAGGVSGELGSLMTKTFPMSMSFLLKGMTFPKISFETVKLNQYNKYVTRPRKVIYDPVNITFNDIYTSHQTTENNRVSLMTFMREYVSYYTNDVVKSGYKIQNGLSSDREVFNFISSIDIYFFWNTGAKKLSLVNPFIDSFSYSDLSYEEDNIMNLNCNVQYEYLDMYDIDINVNEFIETASHLLDEVDMGHSPLTPNLSDSNLDLVALQPIQPVNDSQRRIGLDNPVAAMAIQLAETAALKKFGSNLQSNDPVKRAIAGGAYALGVDAVATATNATSNAVSGLTKGLF